MQRRRDDEVTDRQARGVAGVSYSGVVSCVAEPFLMIIVYDAVYDRRIYRSKLQGRSASGVREVALAARPSASFDVPFMHHAIVMLSG